jgi:hypothetical protein
VETARNEFKLLMRLDNSAGLLQIENPIKTMNAKRANRDRDEIAEGANMKSKWGQGSKHSFFSQNNLNCLEIASCKSNVIKASYIAEFQFES